MCKIMEEIVVDGKKQKEKDFRFLCQKREYTHWKKR